MTLCPAGRTGARPPARGTPRRRGTEQPHDGALGQPARLVDLRQGGGVALAGHGLEDQQPTRQGVGVVVALAPLFLGHGRLSSRVRCLRRLDTNLEWCSTIADEQVRASEEDCRVRLALVGTGFIAAATLPPQPASRMSRSWRSPTGTPAPPPVRARAWGARVVPDVADLLADDDVDALVVCTPNDTHATLARAAAAGKHLLLEKPMALSAADARSVADAFAAAGRVLLVGHTHRHTDYARAVHDVIVVRPAGHRALRADRHHRRLDLGRVVGVGARPGAVGRARVPQRRPPLRPGPLVARFADRLGVCGGAAAHVRGPRHRRLPLQHAGRGVRGHGGLRDQPRASGHGRRRCSRSSSTATAEPWSAPTAARGWSPTRRAARGRGRCRGPTRSGASSRVFAAAVAGTAPVDPGPEAAVDATAVAEAVERSARSGESVAVAR